jgi:transposase InsO family protein
MRHVSDAQVRKLMEEMTKHGKLGQAAMKADMDRKTARKYVAAGKLPSEMKAPRDWRTRPDPFVEHWPEVQARLEATPEFEAKTLFEVLRDEHPERYADGQLRTLQRRVKAWRAAHGPDQEVVLAQRHRAGEAAQTDFTSTAELGVTIAGAAFVHLLCVLVLPYSNWQWATVCLSESLAALRKGVQRALFQLGRKPLHHQTDNSTAATHQISDGEKGFIDGRKRPFNEGYLAMMRHFGMTPRTTEVGAKEQNGDVESGHGALKRRLEQALLLRGSRDFPDHDAWQAFVDEVVRRANGRRGPRVAEELAAMRPLDVGRLPEFVEDAAVVSEWSTIRVQKNAYSVPSRLIGEELRVHVYEDRLEAYFGEKLELACERLRGRNQCRIDYRHMIWSLVRKPGGFARYVYREEMFPSLVFRKAYDAIQTPHHGTSGDLEYLRILYLAATTMQIDVEAALAGRLTAAEPITADRVKALVVRDTAPEIPALVSSPVDLHVYDQLLPEVAA